MMLATQDPFLRRMWPPALVLVVESGIFLPMFAFLWDGSRAVAPLIVGVGLVPLTLGLLRWSPLTALPPCLLAFAAAVGVAEIIRGPDFYYDNEWWGFILKMTWTWGWFMAAAYGVGLGMRLGAGALRRPGAGNNG